MPRSRIITLVESFNALSEVEQKVFLDLVDPQPEPELKQTRRRRGRSPRAQSLSSAISQTPKLAICGICGNLKGHPEHDTEHYLGAHPFKSPASSAGKKSSRKGAATNSTVNTEGDTESVSAVGASAGD